MDEKDLIKVQCPNCSTILSVLRVPNMERKFITCPACHQKTAFLKCKVIGGAAPQEATAGPESSAIGSLIDTRYPGQPIHLVEGQNIVGRKATTSKAHIQIVPPQGDMRISREHLLIDVSRVPGKGYLHHLSLCKKDVNDTFLNDSKIGYPEKVLLKSMDLVRLPGVTLRFELPDGESTRVAQ